MESKPKIYKYYAIRQGNSVLIRRSFTQIARVRCTIKVPKLPDSPKYLDDGFTPNKGLEITQVCYTGGELAGSMSTILYKQKVDPGFKLLNGQAVRLTLAQKRTVKELLANQ